MDTNACRAFTFQMGQRMDDVTDDCDWTIHRDMTAMPRAEYLAWYWQIKFLAAKNVAHVCDKMLHACGGTGYKKDLGIERLLRDGKAGWVMGPTNEVLRQFVGKLALLGMDSLDYWNQHVNERVVHNEVKKMDAGQKNGTGREADGRGRRRGGEGAPQRRGGVRPTPGGKPPVPSLPG